MIEPAAYRVLLIEDNDLDARAMSRMLQGETKCEVHRAADLAAGVEAITIESFDCVLLDLSLPDSHGLESVETMVSHAINCPVVVLTGLDDPDTAVAAVASGAQDYLVKNTINNEIVERAIRYAVARHSAENGLRLAEERLSVMHSREQIARDLHDTVIQRLFATGMSLQAASSLRSRDDMADRLSSAVDQIDDAIRELRQAIFGLNTIDEGETIAFALAQLADSYEETLGFRPVVRLGDVPPLGDEVHADLVATAREALSNVARHSDATQVTVGVTAEDGYVVMRVTDNGTGAVTEADAPAASTADNDDASLHGHGLTNIEARAQAHGGDLELTTRPTGGTELRWRARL